MADFKQNYFQRRTKARGPRTNQRITSQDVQVIASDGDNLGILNLQDAISRAKEQGLDLIEIAPNTTSFIQIDGGADVDSIDVKILNAFVAPKKNLKTTINF